MLPILTAFLVLLVVYIYRFYENVKKYPKGPTPLPFIGNLHMFNWQVAHEQFADLSREFGNVFTIWLPRPHVCIMDYDNMKEAFHTKGDDFSGRTKIFPDTLFQTKDNGGVIFSDGDDWREQRRVSLHILRDFGMGKNVMEQQVASSMRDCLDHLYSLEDQRNSMDMRWPIQLFVGNVITNTLYGFRYKYNDCERMAIFADGLNKQMEEIKDSKLFFLTQNFPWIKHLPFIGHNAHGRFMDNAQPLKDIVAGDIVTAMKQYDSHQDPECFVHAYKHKMETNDMLTDDQLANVCMDFYLAGMETTSTTLRWSVLYLADKPHIQDKLREEIISVLGSERMVTMNDKPKLPYTSAVINEVQRLANIVPLNVLHRTNKATTVGKHPIPEDTFVFGVLSNVLMNSPVYKNGQKFEPERFLMEDGLTARKEAVEHLVPFSIGKRQCAGESLARMELFIGLTSLIQHFKFEPRTGHKIDTSPELFSLLLPKPQDFKITVVNA